jgi:thiamine kinase-like enzyme
MHQNEVPEIRSQKENFKQRIQAVKLLNEEQKEFIINYLKNLSGGAILCHGDFHWDNIIISGKESFVIDWSNIFVGDHHADIARTLYILRYSYDPNSHQQSSLFNFIAKFFQFYSSRRYFKIYNNLKKTSLKEVKKWNLIIYAARLREEIAEEQDFLLKKIEKELSKLQPF